MILKVLARHPAAPVPTSEFQECSSCLDVIQRLTYRNVLFFEIDPEAVQTAGANTRIKFLDLVILWSSLNLIVTQNNKNIGLLASGILPLRKQFKLPLFAGVFLPSQFQKMFQELSGRRARWAQLGFLEDLGPLLLSLDTFGCLIYFHCFSDHSILSFARI